MGLLFPINLCQMVFFLSTNNVVSLVFFISFANLHWVYWTFSFFLQFPQNKLKLSNMLPTLPTSSTGFQSKQNNMLQKCNQAVRRSVLMANRLHSFILYTLSLSLLLALSLLRTLSASLSSATHSIHTSFNMLRFCFFRGVSIEWEKK